VVRAAWVSQRRNCASRVETVEQSPHILVGDEST
jgi:hypothetical protein